MEVKSIQSVKTVYWQYLKKRLRISEFLWYIGRNRPKTTGKNGKIFLNNYIVFEDRECEDFTIFNHFLITSLSIIKYWNEIIDFNA